MNVVAIIPARAGSKRIPNKNIRNFLGTPILVRVIEQLMNVSIISKVYVSTDSTEIASIARSAGAVIPFVRPAEIADDFASTSDVIRHAINEIDEITQDTVVVCVYPTSVGLIEEDLNSAWEMHKSKKWQFIFSATIANSSPFRSFELDSEFGVKMIFPEYREFRSQDLPEVFSDAGLFYMAQAKTWLHQEHIFTSRSTIIKVPSWRAIDINTEEDWLASENLHKILNLKLTPSSRS